MKKLPAKKYNSSAKPERQQEKMLKASEPRLPATEPPRIKSMQKMSAEHDPEYYHSDNSQNRSEPGIPSPGQSPNKTQRENDEG